MALTLIYRIFVMFVSWMVLQARPDTAKEIEILVLRHQLVVLQRRTPGPRLRWTDRAIIAALLIAIGAGLAVGLGAIATGLAQSRIGAAAMGAVAEKPELMGRAILLVAIPETLVILGFAVAATAHQCGHREPTPSPNASSRRSAANSWTGS